MDEPALKLSFKIDPDPESLGGHLYPQPGQEVIFRPKLSDREEKFTIHCTCGGRWGGTFERGGPKRLDGLRCNSCGTAYSAELDQHELWDLPQDYR